jgi:hypothetical protein
MWPDGLASKLCEAFQVRGQQGTTISHVGADLGVRSLGCRWLVYLPLRSKKLPLWVWFAQTFTLRSCKPLLNSVPPLHPLDLSHQSPLIMATTPTPAHHPSLSVGLGGSTVCLLPSLTRILDFHEIAAREAFQGRI